VRVDPNALGAVAQLGVVAVVGALAASLAPTPTSSVLMVAVTGAVSLVLAVRALRRATGGLGGEGLATSLTDEMRAVLEAPVGAPVGAPALPAAQAAQAAATATPFDEVPVLDACPRCRSALPEAAGAFHQRECPRGCGALVLDSERLLVDRAGLDLEVVRALVREQGVKKGTCPSCASETAMHQGRLRGLEVDLCLACGALWLDKSELASLSRERLFQGAKEGAS
jgi:hypothetical protein